MCGISGIVGINGSITDKHIRQTNILVNNIIHRGPNQKIVKKINKKNCIGFVRLAIIDLTKNSDQPIQSLDKKISLIFNGEIYNHLDIRKDINACKIWLRCNRTYRSKSIKFNNLFWRS